MQSMRKETRILGVQQKLLLFMLSLQAQACLQNTGTSCLNRIWTIKISGLKSYGNHTPPLMCNPFWNQCGVFPKLTPSPTAVQAVSSTCEPLLLSPLASLCSGWGERYSCPGGPLPGITQWCVIDKVVSHNNVDRQYRGIQSTIQTQLGCHLRENPCCTCKDHFNQQINANSAACPNNPCCLSDTGTYPSNEKVIPRETFQLGEF